MLPTSAFSFWSRDYNIPLHKESCFACVVPLFSLCKIKLSGSQVLVWLSTNADLTVQDDPHNWSYFQSPPNFPLSSTGLVLTSRVLCNCHPTLEPSLCFCLNVFNGTLNFLQPGNIFLRHPSGSKDQPPSMYSSSSSQPLWYSQSNASPQRNNLVPEASFPFSNNFQYNTCFARVSYSPLAPHLSSLRFQAPPVLWIASLLFSLSLTIADLQPLSQAAPSRSQKLCLPAGPSLICHSCCWINALNVQLAELHQGI